MKHEVHRRLTDLASASDKEYGKLVQKLLAIAFCDRSSSRCQSFLRESGFITAELIQCTRSSLRVALPQPSGGVRRAVMHRI